MKTFEHVCRAEPCPIIVPSGMLMCRDHWYAVPKPLRDEVNRTYRDWLRAPRGTGSAVFSAYFAAVEEAVKTVSE